MARKIYREEELNEEWKEAREKAIERGMALGHSNGSQRNDRMLSLYVACEFQDLGVLRPEDITQELFLEWKDHVMSDLNRSGKGITENGFKKRKEAYLLIMRANKLQDQIEIGEMHKQRISPSEFSFWDDETLEQMTVRAMEIFDNEPKKRAAAIAHMIHSDCPPRREDTARMRWSYFDFKDGKLLFPARKNGERPGNFIDERFIPYFRRWKEETSRYPDGDDLVFPHHEMCAGHAHVATGTPFARAYAHAGMVGYDGEKMSKSRGNLVFVSALRNSDVDPMAIRLTLLRHHYRADWEWTDAELFDQVDTLDRWRRALALGAGAPAEPVVTEVLAALADDLDAPRAVSAVDAWVPWRRSTTTRSRRRCAWPWRGPGGTARRPRRSWPGPTRRYAAWPVTTPRPGSVGCPGCSRWWRGPERGDPAPKMPRGGGGATRILLP